jgi:uncharacterized protein YyaL (SSP411 family)
MIADRVQAGARWLTASGAQLPDGGFAPWYDAGSQDYPYVYAEITGYLTTLLGHLGEWAAATAAGDWLVRHADGDTGGFRCLVPLRPSRFDEKQHHVYAFDTGVIVNGLTNLHRATGGETYRRAAVRAADWLVDAAQLPSGGFRPIWDSRSGAFVAARDDWSWRPGGFQAKVAAGLANLAELTGDVRYRDAAVRAADFAVGQLDATGRDTHAHPYAYTAEGLWATGTMLGRPEYVEASRRATAWLLSLQRADGLVPRFVRDGVPLYAERRDVQAQALRLAVLHGLAGRVDELTARLVAGQAVDDDRRIDGGWWFGSLSDGTTVPHVNVWTTAFAVQTLQLRAGAPLDPRFLV